MNACTDSSLSNNVSSQFKTISTANKNVSVTSERFGSIRFDKDGESLPLFSKTHFSDDFSENIMSVSEAVENGYMVVFTKSGVAFYKSGTIINEVPILTGHRCDQSNQFYLELPDPRQ